MNAASGQQVFKKAIFIYPIIIDLTERLVMNIAIIIPAFNEEKTIRDVVLDFGRELPDASIYVIDNNSGDQTGNIAQSTLSEIKNSGKVLFESRQGKANAIRKAFTEIEADIYVMVDADLTYPANDVHRLIEPVKSGMADMTVGDRMSEGKYRTENKRKFHNLGNNFIKLCINAIFRTNMNDIMTGYRAFSRKFVKNYPVLIEGFELETDITLHALDNRFTIIEVPIDYRDRPEGSFSKLNTYRDGIRVVFTIIRMLKNYRPFIFFGSLSFICFLLGLSAGFPVILEFIRTQYISHIPLAILATGLMIFSLLLFSVGLILNTVVNLHKMNYELRLLDNA